MSASSSETLPQWHTYLILNTLLKDSQDLLSTKTAGSRSSAHRRGRQRPSSWLGRLTVLTLLLSRLAVLSLLGLTILTLLRLTILLLLLRRLTILLLLRWLAVLPLRVLSLRLAVLSLLGLTVLSLLLRMTVLALLRLAVLRRRSSSRGCVLS